MNNDLTERNMVEIFLHSGEFYWGDASNRIKTILGSCIAICMWHPEIAIGGMSHSLLPENLERSSLSARYIDDSVELFRREMSKINTYPAEYVVKIFGGGEVLMTDPSRKSVGIKNIEAARLVLQKHGFKISAEDLGGRIRRNLIFDLQSGDAWLKRVEAELVQENIKMRKV